MENPIKMDDLGVPLFSETSIFGSLAQMAQYGTNLIYLQNWIVLGVNV